MQNLFAHAERLEHSKITTIIPPETETCKILKVIYTSIKIKYVQLELMTMPIKESKLYHCTCYHFLMISDNDPHYTVKLYI